MSPNYAAYPVEERGFMDLNVGQSIYVGWNMFRLSQAFNRTHSLGFTTGLSLVWNNYAFAENLTVVRRDRMIHPEPIGDQYKKSKITTFSLMIPLVFEVSHRNFFCSAGVYGGVVLGAHTKYKKPKHKTKSNPYLNTFQAGITARLGLRRLYAFTNVALTPFFVNAKGPDTQTYTIGFGIRL